MDSDDSRRRDRSHRYRESTDRHSRRRISRDRDDERQRRRRDSRSPESRRNRSRDRDGGRSRKERDSRSPRMESRDERRNRHSSDESEYEARDFKRRHKRRRSRPQDGSHGHEGRQEKKRFGDDDQIVARRGGPLPLQEDLFAVSKGEVPENPKEKPNFGNTGHLAAASNSVTQADGTIITLKYHEPPEARKPPPKDQWKLFVFKGNDVVDTVDLGGRSCWLVGRENSVVDMLAEHPSISKQHAVIQFRYTEKRNEFGDRIGKVKPYVIDLESANGTELNGEKIPDRRYLELRPKDVVKLGSSTREYVVMLARD